MENFSQQPIPNIRLKPLDEQGYFVRDWYTALTQAIGGAAGNAAEAFAVATQALADALAAQGTADQAIIDAAAALAAAAAAQADADALEQVEYVLGAADPTAPNARVLTGDTGLTIDLSTPNIIQLLLNVVAALGYTPADVAGDTFTGSVDVQAALQCDSLRIDQTPTAAVVVQSHYANVDFNGVTYKVLLAP